MTDIFLKILNMSISASFVCAAVVVARLMLRRAPRWIMLLLWLAVAVRLVCPISFESEVSLMPMADTVPQNIGVADTPAIHSGIEPLNNAVNPLLQTDSLAPTPMYSANPMQIVTFIASIVWVAGICLMILYTLISYIRLKLRVRISLPMEGAHNVRLCDSIDSPFILGFIRPVIYLPSSIDEADAKHVLAHERCHIKRFDFIWKPLGFMLLAIHWFNPIMWVAYVLLCRDIECGCDEAVLKKSGSEIKSTYATALINCSVSRKSIAACPLAFGETGLKMRVKNVLSYKKPTVWLILAGLIVCAAVGIFLLTDPASIAITELHEEETGSYEDIFENVETLTVYQGKMTSDVYDKDTVANVIDTLKEVRLKKRPISKDRSDERDMTNRVQLGDGNQLCFSEDYSEFWIYTGTKPSLSYKVLNPEVAERAVIEKSSFLNEVGFTVGKFGGDTDMVTANLTGIVTNSRGGYLEVLLTNSSRKSVNYGDEFYLYYIGADGKAESCEISDRLFHLVGHGLKGHSSVTYKYNLAGCDLTKAGKYRFETDIHIGVGEEYEEYTVWFEFTLPKGISDGNTDNIEETDETINEVKTDPVHEHTYTLKETIDNGCESFITEIYVCSDCGEEKSEDGDEKGEHTYELTRETSATCLSAGSLTYTCKVCDDTYSEEAPSLGHIFAPATCTSPSICTVCSATEGEALPHTLTWATCTVPATCTVCGTTAGGTVPHSYTEATCTAPATCTVCGEVNGTSLEHDFADATMDAPKTCRTCGATEGEALPKLTIDMTSYVAKTVSVTAPTIVYDRYGRPTSHNTTVFQMNILDLSYDIIGYNEETGYELQFKLKTQKTNSSETSSHDPIGMVDGYIMQSPDSEYAVEGLYWTFTDCFEGDIVEGSVTVSVPPGNYYFLVKEEISRVSLARSGGYKWSLKVNDITSIETPSYLMDTINQLKSNNTN